MSSYISVILSLFLIAFVFSLPALLPPVRRWARSGFDARGIATLLLAALTFFSTITILFVAMTYIGTMIMIMKGGMFPHQAATESELISELWRRQLIPSPFSRPCYTTVATCALVDEAAPFLGFAIEYLRIAIIPSFIAASINIFMVMWYTRPTPYKGGTTGRMIWEG